MPRYKPPILRTGKVAKADSNVGKEAPAAWPARPPPWHEFLPRPFGGPASWSNPSLREGRVASSLLRARHEPSQPVEPVTREAAENVTGIDLRGVRIHTGPASEAAAAELDARAFTVGSDIHLGGEASLGASVDRRELITHELVHAAQQGARPAALQGTLPVSDPADRSEGVARAVASEVVRPQARKQLAAASPALRMRDRIRATPAPPSIQRDIKGSKALPRGTLKIDFTKLDASVPGKAAKEDGSITFTPSAKAPDSNEIHFIQVVRFFDTSAGTEGHVGKAPPAVHTKKDAAKKIVPGFFVDELYDYVHPRKKKADAAVSPFYDAPPTVPGTVIGKKKGKTIVPAVLTDTPKNSSPSWFKFVTSAKGSDTGIGYGTVLWGFEVFQDKTGVAKIKNEYHSFRSDEGPTAHEALRRFNEFAHNPGSSTAPKK